MINKNKNKQIAVDAAELSEVKDKLQCGLIMPISKSQGLEPAHWLNVKSIISEALDGTGFEIKLVSDSDDVGVIHKSIVQNIFKNDIVICDVSTHNANVMFELGLRLAFDKPTVIIKDDETPFSFDTHVIQHIVYKRSLHYPDIVSFKKELRMKVLATMEQSKKEGFSTFLKHFTIEHVSKISEREVSKDDFLMEQLTSIHKTMKSIALFNGQNANANVVRRVGGGGRVSLSDRDSREFPEKQIERGIRRFVRNYVLESELSTDMFLDKIKNNDEVLLCELQSACSEYMFDRYKVGFGELTLRNIILEAINDIYLKVDV
ncbi:hypothetical protein [Aeromonas salmonicida]|uniref:hypothetical protein n=1 Tax=Aeromonas salmonicida TaxID=645 RepID=UPI0012D9094D|nr:hypothetical protein [Aeromonas salmonicida]MUG30135.1 hypothetical protein [Aeromonas salmonicida]